MKTGFNGLRTNYKTDEGNLFVFSSLNEFSREWKSGLPAATIRYVISGEELYDVNKETFQVGKGNFLLVNKAQPHSAHMPYRSESVSGFCIAVSNSMLNDVHRNNLSDDLSMLDNPFKSEEVAFDFLESIYKPGDIVSTYLASLEHKLDRTTGLVDVPEDELFYNVAEKLLVSQMLVRGKINSIKASKYSTRQELYKRIDRAKRILDEEKEIELPIAAIAAKVALSEFHFFRIFKQIHNITPHQYRLKKRLQFAKEKLLNTAILITQLALESGFADVESFSKAFKKEFLVSPQCFRNSNKY